jgi:hypothetical protein
MFFAFKNWITEHTSQSAGLVIDMVLYKALWRSNRFTQWLGKHWGHGRGSDDSSQPLKTFGEWPAEMVLTLKVTLELLVSEGISSFEVCQQLCIMIVNTLIIQDVGTVLILGRSLCQDWYVLCIVVWCRHC